MLRPCFMALRHRGANPHAAGLHRDDGSPRQFVPILPQHLLANRALLTRADVDQPHNAGMRQASPDREFAEILVERDEHTLFPVGLRQDLFITRVLRQIPGPQHVMSSCLKFRLGTAPHAGIEQQLHAADSIFRGSIRSWPTMRRA